MAIALVGSIAAHVHVTTTSGTPTLGQATTAGNLLISWVTDNAASANQVTTAATGWTLVGTGSFFTGVGNTYVFYRPNCGAGEAAPTFTLTGNTDGNISIAEFSGAATVSPVDASGVASGGPGGSPLTNNATTVDGQVGDLIVTSDIAAWSTSAARTTTATYNNGATAILASSQSGSAARFYEFAYGFTTGNSVADQDSYAVSVTTGMIGLMSMLASFKPAGAGPAFIAPKGSMADQALQRATTW